LHLAAQYFEKGPGDEAAQQKASLAVRQRIQTRLDEGETHDFRTTGKREQNATANHHSNEAKRSTKGLERG
jgi:cell filamentation protein